MRPRPESLALHLTRWKLTGELPDLGVVDDLAENEVALGVYSYLTPPGRFEDRAPDLVALFANPGHVPGRLFDPVALDEMLGGAEWEPAQPGRPSYARNLPIHGVVVYVRDQNAAADRLGVLLGATRGEQKSGYVEISADVVWDTAPLPGLVADFRRGEENRRGEETSGG